MATSANTILNGNANVDATTEPDRLGARLAVGLGLAVEEAEVHEMPVPGADTVRVRRPLELTVKR